MVFKLTEAAQRSWRRLDGRYLRQILAKLFEHTKSNTAYAGG
jgi:hypothetical protein